MYDLNKRYKPESKILNECLCVTSFNSISHFMNYIEGDVNTVINNMTQSSHEVSKYYKEFSGTETFEEAKQLLTNGYDVGCELIKHTLLVDNKNEDKQERRIISDVVGFQPIVPNYLMGLPNSMLNNKMVVKKKKVITINKCIDFSGWATTSEITKSSARTVRIIKSLESQGYAINLNIIDGYKVNDVNEIIKIRVKNSNEPFNLKKLSFPLMHPSMLRRMLFKYVEISDTTRDRENRIGCCVSDSLYLNLCKQTQEIFINRLISENTMDNTVKLIVGELQK